MKLIQSLSTAVCAVALAASACEISNNGSSGGGTTSTGGSHTGGQVASGGSAAAGQIGTTGPAGSVAGANGGTPSAGSGGNAAAGSISAGSSGNSSAGGGGTTGSAGASGGAGGSKASGGSTGAGGSTSAGGSTTGTGGSTSAGGSTTGTGGSTNAGGSTSAGGSNGGTAGSATGGFTGTGGNSAAGSGGTAGKGGSSGNTGGAKGSGGSAGGAGGSASGGSTSTSSGTGTCSASSDTCPAPNGGVTFNCKKRFSYGVNYAWSYFGGDFGGIAAWNQQGVAGAKAARTTDMTDMKNNGADVVRWWMFPDMGGDGIKLDSSKTPSGVGSTLVADINAALDIAATLDMHIKLTLFSFDSFWADFTNSGITFPSLQPIAIDATKRAALIKNVVIPIAQAVQASPNRDRMVAWDVVNEPEWSIAAGTDPYGDQAFQPTMSGSSGQTMATVTFAQMETFVKDVVTALHGASTAPVTVGSAAVKWAKAWSQVGLDFYDFHWYGWVDQWYPHTNTPTFYKVNDKQVVVGEFPLNPSADSSGAFGGATYGKLVDDWFAAGYAGAQGWAFSDTAGAFNWSNGKANVKAWATAHTCYTHY